MVNKINWRSKALWGSVAAGTLLILQGTGIISVPEQYNAIQTASNSVLVALVTLGVLTDTSA